MTNEKLGKIEANFSKKAVARKKLDRLAADQQVPSLLISRFQVIYPPNDPNIRQY